MAWSARGFVLAAIGVSLLSLALSAPAAAHGLAARDKQFYKSAFAAVEKDRWTEAARLAGKAKNRLPAKIIHWLDLTRPGPGRSFEDYRRFIEANPHWPKQAELLAQAERAMSDGLPGAAVIAWFGAREPATLEGSMRLARALMDAKDKARAEALLRRGWVEFDGLEATEKAFLRRHAALLQPEHHVRRLDRLLWEEETEAAARMMPLVDSGRRAVALLRIRLMTQSPGVDAALAQVPAPLLKDPGLLFDRARWHRRKGDVDKAVALLDPPPVAPGHVEALWPELEKAARRALERGDAKTAYRIAKGHGATGAIVFAEGEWLAGWIALRFLLQPETALVHFVRLFKGVDSALSQARGAYWAGRASEIVGDKTASMEWYRAAGANLTYFYGQLAAQKLGRNGAMRFSEPPRSTKAQKTDFEQKELVQVVHLLAELEESDHARPFLLRLGEQAVSPADHRLVADLAKGIGRDDFMVVVSKLSRHQGVELVDQLFPLRQLPKGAGTEDALVLGTLRQESAFAVAAVSSAGALGLMQLMPATAKHVAKSLKVKYSKKRLTSDPDYNMTLGRAYLAEMLGEFGGSYVLAVAAYNAGPTRVKEWIARNGDPRSAGVDVIDWIEMIPIYETRNYVQRVLENLQVYRHRLGKTQVALRLEQDLGRKAE